MNKKKGRLRSTSWRQSSNPSFINDQYTAKLQISKDIYRQTQNRHQVIISNGLD